VLANRLSADPKNSVLLLEAGGKDDWIWIHIPVGYLFCIGNPRTDWCYKTEPEPGLNGRSILYARGRVLGGSSSINAMLYLRGQARAITTSGRSSPAMRAGPGRTCSPSSGNPRTTGRRDEFHGARDASDGAGHEWRRRAAAPVVGDSGCLSRRSGEAGIAKIDDFNRGDNAGSSRFEVNQRRGVRVSASKAFLRSRDGAREPHRAHQRTREKTAARRPAQCSAWSFSRGTMKFSPQPGAKPYSQREASASPQLLQLSGIGPGALLQQHGIAVAHDLPGVGENLQDHLQLRMAFRIKNALTLNTMANSWWGKAKMALEYALHRTGPLTMAPSQLGAS